MKRTKFAFVALLVMVMCAVSLGFTQSAYAADENVLTVNITDDYYGNPVDGVAVSVTDTATGTVVAEQVTNASGSTTFSLPVGAYKVEQTTYKEGYVPQVDSVSYVFSGASSRLGDEVVAEMKNQPLLGHIIVKVVGTDGNPIAGATLKATAANIAGPGVTTPPFTQTGILTMEADGSYSLTTGADGTVVIPNLIGNTSTTITQLTTIDGYQIDTTVRVGQITGTDTTATVTFVDPQIPHTVPDPDPTPAPEPQPQPEAPKAKKVKKSVLPNTGDNALTLPLIIGVAGATIVVAAAALFLHKKRQ